MLPMEALASVRGELRRVFVASGVEEVRRDRVDRTAVEQALVTPRHLHDVHDADHHRRPPRPLDALARVVDLAAMGADPAQPGRPRVSLPDRVRRDQPECAISSQQVEDAPIEVRDQVGVTMAFLVQLLQPVEVVLGFALPSRVLASERRIPDDRIESRPLALEHLGELDLPVERHERRLGLAQLFEPAAKALGVTVVDCLRELRPLGLPLAALRPREERRDDEVAEEPHLRQLELRFVPQVAQHAVGRVVVGLADLAPQFGDPLDVLADPDRLEAATRRTSSGTPRSGGARARRASRRGVARGRRR